MQTISQALDSRIKTLSDGLKKNGGETIIQSPTPEANQTSPQNEGCYEHLTQISDSLDDRKKLNILIKNCYNSLNTYGGSNEGLEATIMLMQMTLGRFDYETVRAAFGVYLQTGKDMPKPADIIQIIEPKPEKKEWSTTAFIDIKRRIREGQFVPKEERQFCNDFITNAVKQQPDSRVAMDGAIRLVEEQDKKYWIGAE